MFGIRTPTKKVSQPTEKIPTMKAGPSKTTDATSSRVRKSIGDWESGRVSKSPIKQNSPAVSGPSVVMPQSETTEKTTKYSSRVAEAKACLMSAKKLLSSSRNLKTEIKTDVHKAIERLYALVKEAEEERKRNLEKETEKKEELENKEEHEEKEESVKKQKENVGKKEEAGLTATTIGLEQTALMRALVEGMKEHGRKMDECIDYTRTLTDQLRSCPPPASVVDVGRSYAMVAAVKNPRPQIHSFVVAGENTSSEELLGKIRHAVDAKTSGIQVERIRKAKGQKVVMGFGSREELAKASQKICKTGDLQVEEIRNKDPLVVLFDVMTYITDDDVMTSLRNQNRKLFQEIPAEDQRLSVKYRRKTRNHLQCHIVLQVSPQLWQRLIAAERVYVDVQNVRVADQTPLVQCSLCLAYGHGRKYCTEKTNTCSYCGGPHPWTECPDRLAGAKPRCCNCIKAKHENVDHAAYNKQCAVRLKWDALARATTAYS